MTFAAGVFTNLTRDHLDFHADMDDYFRAKRRLFEMLPRDAPSLINLDDPRGAALRRRRRPARDLRDQPPGGRHAGTVVVLARGPGVRRPHAARHRARASKLVGRPNVYNILAAVSTAIALDVPLDAIERGLQSLDGVPGRFQVVSGPKDEVTVVVDYAHTDDALRNLLETARPLAHGPPDHRVRLRRRSRSHEAAADGRGRRAPERSDRDHVGQPARRGSERGSSRRCSAASPPTRAATARRGPLAIVDRRRGDCQGDRGGAARRSSC